MIHSQECKFDIIPICSSRHWRGLLGDLIDHYWHKRYIMRNDDAYYKKFPRKQTLIKQPLEGAATYFGKERIK